MIKNDRQYRIAKAAADRFRAALERLADSTARSLPDVDPIVRQAQADALRSQLTDLETELREYESLSTGKAQSLTVETLEDLPKALIQARIAARLSQKELGDALGLKEQQIQRYEATDYRQASFARLLQVAKALGLRLSEDLVLPTAVPDSRTFLSLLRDVGLPKRFLLDRLVPRRIVEQWTSGVADAEEAVVRAGTRAVSRVFGWSPSSILGREQPAFARAAAATARYKLSANADERFVGVYTVYAHYLAMVVLRATEQLPTRAIPTDPEETHEAIRTRYGEVSFRTALSYCWDLGIPVLPLNDPGAFHGAFWRIAGRNVIVLKQRTRSLARWLFDLIHELDHAASEPEVSSREILEVSDSDRERRESDEEQHASWYAGEVILGGRAEELTKRCVTRARGSVELLKDAVTRVAQQEGVAVDSLANYVAFRLSLQDINWWGTATNLQPKDETPWEIARDVLLCQVDFTKLAPPDRELLTLALAEYEVAHVTQEDD